MDAKVEVGVLQANACLVVVHTTVEILSGNVHTSPVVSSLSFAPITSVSGHSISAVNPEFNRIGVRAAA
jgi:hypothetical protein